MTAPRKLPSLISVEGRAMQSGFASGQLRDQRAIPAFRINKHPVTWAELNACTKAGACAAPDASACGDAAYEPHATYSALGWSSKSKTAPATCVGEAQAESFCAWIGGRLPMPDEWLLAARGDTPRRFSWGDDVTSCDQHPLAGEMAKQRALQAGAAPTDPKDALECPDPREDVALDVGQHPGGASPSGMEDVLLAPAELLGADPDSMFNACGAEGDHCVVFGLEPAAIDSVEPFLDLPPSAENGNAGQRFIAHAYGFRCVLAPQNEVTP